MASPSAGAILADLGADVIKIEPLSGDPMRDMGRPAKVSEDKKDFDFQFDVSNRGKRSIAIDLESEAGMEVVLSLLTGADIFMCNLLRHRQEKFGLDPESVKQANSNIVHATLTGYGTHGPEAHRPGYDVTLHGEFVAPSWTGIAENDEHIWELFLVAIYASAALFLVQGLLRGPIGRAFIASRDQPEAARAFGVPVYQLRVFGVALSGGMAGLAGGLLMIPTNFNDFTHYPEELSIKMFALAMAFGGSRLISSIPAALVLIFLPVWLIDRNWVVEYGWVGLFKSEGFIYAALLLATAYLTRGKGFMNLSERRNRETPVPINRGASLVADKLVALEDRLNQIEEFVEERPDIRSRQETTD